MITGKMENVFNDLIEQLPEKDQEFFMKIRYKVSSFWVKYLKPIALMISMFYIFTRIRNKLGHDYVIFVLAVIGINYLRQINAKLG